MNVNELWQSILTGAKDAKRHNPCGCESPSDGDLECCSRCSAIISLVEDLRNLADHLENGNPLPEV